MAARRKAPPSSLSLLQSLPLPKDLTDSLTEALRLPSTQSSPRLFDSNPKRRTPDYAQRAERYNQILQLLKSEPAKPAQKQGPGLCGGGVFAGVGRMGRIARRESAAENGEPINVAQETVACELRKTKSSSRMEGTVSGVAKRSVGIAGKDKHVGSDRPVNAKSTGDSCQNVPGQMVASGCTTQLARKPLEKLSKGPVMSHVCLTNLSKGSVRQGLRERSENAAENEPLRPISVEKLKGQLYGAEWKEGRSTKAVAGKGKIGADQARGFDLTSNLQLEALNESERVSQRRAQNTKREDAAENGTPFEPEEIEAEKLEGPDSATAVGVEVLETKQTPGGTPPLSPTSQEAALLVELQSLDRRLETVRVLNARMRRCAYVNHGATETLPDVSQTNKEESQGENEGLVWGAETNPPAQNKRTEADAKAVEAFADAVSATVGGRAVGSGRELEAEEKVGAQEVGTEAARQSGRLSKSFSAVRAVGVRSLVVPLRSASLSAAKTPERPRFSGAKISAGRVVCETPDPKTPNLRPLSARRLSVSTEPDSKTSLEAGVLRALPRPRRHSADSSFESRRTASLKSTQPRRLSSKFTRVRPVFGVPTKEGGEPAIEERTLGKRWSRKKGESGIHGRETESSEIKLRRGDTMSASAEALPDSAGPAGQSNGRSRSENGANETAEPATVATTEVEGCENAETGLFASTDGFRNGTRKLGGPTLPDQENNRSAVQRIDASKPMSSDAPPTVFLKLSQLVPRKKRAVSCTEGRHVSVSDGENLRRIRTSAADGVGGSTHEAGARRRAVSQTETCYAGLGVHQPEAVKGPGSRQIPGGFVVDWPEEEKEGDCEKVPGEQNRGQELVGKIQRAKELALSLASFARRQAAARPGSDSENEISRGEQRQGASMTNERLEGARLETGESLSNVAPTSEQSDTATEEDWADFVGAHVAEVGSADSPGDVNDCSAGEVSREVLDLSAERESLRPVDTDPGKGDGGGLIATTRAYKGGVSGFWERVTAPPPRAITNGTEGVSGRSEKGLVETELEFPATESPLVGSAGSDTGPAQSAVRKLVARFERYAENAEAASAQGESAHDDVSSVTSAKAGTSNADLSGEAPALEPSEPGELTGADQLDWDGKEPIWVQWERELLDYSSGEETPRAAEKDAGLSEAEFCPAPLCASF